jgi:hypothetical protein
MTIYLYVKTHLVTGLKYLGQTAEKDPHKYPGSGKYWKNHLKKHGRLYRTEIIETCETLEEIRRWGLYYSNIWSVVQSKKWANLKEETGDARGKLHPDSIRKISEANRNRVIKDSTRKKISNNQRGNNHWTKKLGRGHSEETKQKIRESKKGFVARPKGFNHSEEIKQKIKEARSKQPFLEETKLKIGNANRGKNKPKLKCPFCQKIGGSPQMKQWHFDNCKFKSKN